MNNKRITEIAVHEKAIVKSIDYRIRIKSSKIYSVFFTEIFDLIAYFGYSNIVITMDRN